jgi:hypothetical protein
MNASQRLIETILCLGTLATAAQAQTVHPVNLGQIRPNNGYVPTIRPVSLGATLMGLVYIPALIEWSLGNPFAHKIEIPAAKLPPTAVAVDVRKSPGDYGYRCEPIPHGILLRRGADGCPKPAGPRSP